MTHAINILIAALTGLTAFSIAYYIFREVAKFCTPANKKVDVKPGFIQDIVTNANQRKAEGK